MNIFLWHILLWYLSPLAPEGRSSAHSMPNLSVKIFIKAESPITLKPVSLREPQNKFTQMSWQFLKILPGKKVWPTLLGVHEPLVSVLRNFFSFTHSHQRNSTLLYPKYSLKLRSPHVTKAKRASYLKATTFIQIPLEVRKNKGQTFC
jgi:hypothetical protein